MSKSDFDRSRSALADPQSRIRRRDEVSRAITSYINDRRFEQVMKRNELADLEGLQRHVTLSKSAIPNAIRRIRLHPRESASVAILMLITLLCDNNQGIATLTIKRMAQMFRRTERSIRETIDSLEADGLLNVERVDGFPNRYWPNVPTALAQANASVVWFVEALSDAPRRRGRPVTAAVNHEVENPGTLVPMIDPQTPERERKNPGTSEHSTSLREFSNRSEEEMPPASPAARRKRVGFEAGELRTSDQAVALYNETARRLGFSQVASFTDKRRALLLKRLADIGGLEQFKVALSAIEYVPFLMGKTPPRSGQQPFLLDFEFLLSTTSNFGDVLANLIDRAAGDPRESLVKDGKRWGWWRGQEAQLRAISLDGWRRVLQVHKTNGERWPWWGLGPPPGDPGCLLPKVLADELASVWNGQLTREVA